VLGNKKGLNGISTGYINTKMGCKSMNGSGFSNGLGGGIRVEKDGIGRELEIKSNGRAISLKRMIPWCTRTIGITKEIWLW
jgi:hypothetical protein